MSRKEIGTRSFFSKKPSLSLSHTHIHAHTHTHTHAHFFISPFFYFFQILFTFLGRFSRKKVTLLQKKEMKKEILVFFQGVQNLGNGKVQKRTASLFDHRALSRTMKKAQRSSHYHKHSCTLLS